jgi:hypothetical protein
MGARMNLDRELQDELLALDDLYRRWPDESGTTKEGRQLEELFYGPIENPTTWEEVNEAVQRLQAKLPAGLVLKCSHEYGYGVFAERKDRRDVVRCLNASV